MAVSDIDALAEVAGEFVDIVKLGWGTAVVTANLDVKLERYRELGWPVILGGTLTELAIKQDCVDQLHTWLRDIGIDHIEISDGSIQLVHEEKLRLIERFAADGFTVLSEVGSKDSEEIMAPYRWVDQIEKELKSGAQWVVTEAREGGNAGIFRPDGEVRMGLIDEIAHAVPFDQLIFEAPRKDQQVWFVSRFGSDVNLGNIRPDGVLSLETLRLGLRADTLDSAK